MNLHFKNNKEGDFSSTLKDEKLNLEKNNSKKELKILALRNTVLMPKSFLSIALNREKSYSIVKNSYEKNEIIGVISQKKVKTEEPELKDLYNIGTLVKVIKISKQENTRIAIIEGLSRFLVKDFVRNEPFLTVSYEKLEEENSIEIENINSKINSLKEKSIRLANLISMPKEVEFSIRKIDKIDFLISFIVSNIPIKTEEKQKILEENNIEKRILFLIKFLDLEIQNSKLNKEIQEKVRGELSEQNKKYLLNQQMKAIQSELGNKENIEIKSLKEKIKNKNWSEEIQKTVDKELEKLERTNQMSPEYSNLLNYLSFLTELPWNEFTKDNFDLKRASDILNGDHFGLENVKDRILEHLAVLKLKGDLKSPIICLYGPPGVGKTSLGRSVANALNRKYVRMSLGGLHDEAEIRGHRRTYIGAMPGRIIQNLKKAKSSNPVFILDEIDKVGNDFRGDPSFALLEVLDPEQNFSFYDNYLELPYDLSKIMFIATANNISQIKPALIDRMELIDVSGYIVEEKIEIAKRHLLPKQLKAHGVKKSSLNVNEETFSFIIENHTRESGVRELDKKIAKLVRVIAKKIGFNENYDKNISVKDLQKILGTPKYLQTKYQGNDYLGVVTGLAWTYVGGKILFVETSLSKGKSGKINLTGNLGKIMKESATLALEYLKAHSEEFQIKYDIFENYNVHVHVPEGAVPKDGPSAGITILTSLASAFTKRKIKKNLAMTGEITLRGKVLPVGGIKEKILAAKRANIKEIILSIDNKKDIDEIKKIYIKNLKFYFVENCKEVLEIALI